MATKTQSPKGRDKHVAREKEILWAFHPGEYIELMLTDNEITLGELAERMQGAPLFVQAGLSPEAIQEKLNEVIAQKKLLSAELIDGFNYAFNGSGDTWVQLQESYLKDFQTLAAQQENTANIE